MNKSKLPLFAVIAAGIVSCGGRGGGSSASDNASDVADNFVNNTFVTSPAITGPVVVDDKAQRWFPKKIPHNINEGDERHKGGKTIFSLEFDFNKDGLMDMLKLRNLNYKGQHLEACINNGDKTFTHDPKYFTAVGATWRVAWEGEFVDINSDGRKDFIVEQSGCFDVCEDDEDSHCTPPMI